MSSYLHNWIDLVFGYKQDGLAARNAINVFHPAVSIVLNIPNYLYFMKDKSG